MENSPRVKHVISTKRGYQAERTEKSPRATLQIRYILTIASPSLWGGARAVNARAERAIFYYSISIVILRYSEGSKNVDILPFGNSICPVRGSIWLRRVATSICGVFTPLCGKVIEINAPSVGNKLPPAPHDDGEPKCGISYLKRRTGDFSASFVGQKALLSSVEMTP